MGSVDLAVVESDKKVGKVEKTVKNHNERAFRSKYLSIRVIFPYEIRELRQYIFTITNIEKQLQCRESQTRPVCGCHMLLFPRLDYTFDS